ncbi:MAG: hypothetical protein HFH60_07795 [Lachnospiraceae bacterium]|nr:hypothetical protein [Lachnospiraceae bacterium]MCI9546570.1 hypothetical protein [Lachnospiraceae bacterium]
MSENQNNPNNQWMDNPQLAGLDKEKLKMLQRLADQGMNKSQSDMLPFLMSAATKGKENGIHFSSDEINAIIEVMKVGKSPKEAARLDKIVSLMKMMKH